MTDTFEFVLDNPLTEEQWDMIADVDMERTDKVTFHTKHGKEVEFAKVRHGRWVERWVDNKHRIGDMECSACGAPMLDCPSYSLYCPWCGARMDENDPRRSNKEKPI